MDAKDTIDPLLRQDFKQNGVYSDQHRKLNHNVEQMETEVEHTPEKNVSFIRKLRCDRTYRAKFILSVCLLWSFVVLGWLEGQLGSSLLDLKVLSRTSFERASGYISFHSVGYLLGSVISGVLFDKCNKVLLVCIILLCDTVAVAAVPWCFMYPLMASFHVIRGIFGGGLECSGNALMMHTWGDQNRSFMQALHFTFALGGMLSPFVTSPFLLPLKDDDDNEAFSLANNGSSTFEYNINGTYTDYQMIRINLSDLNYTESMFRNSPQPQSKLYIAYSISAGLCLSAAIALFLIYISFRNLSDRRVKSHENGTVKRHPELSCCLKLTSLTVICLFCFTYCGIEDTFHGLLMTFIARHMKWKKQTGAYITSLFWASFGCSRFAGIFIVQYVRPLKILFTFCLSLLMTYTGFMFSSLYLYGPGIWICVLCAGVASSVIYASVFTLTEESILPVTGKISSIILIASSLGIILNPIFIGHMMEMVSLLSFPYIILGESVCLMCLWVILFIIVRNIKNIKTIDKD